MRYSKVVKPLVVTAVVLAGLSVVADVVLLQVAQSRAAAGFARATAAERAKVDFGGFPFLPNLVRGRISRIELRSMGLSGGGLRVARLDGRVANVRFSPSEAIALIRSAHASRAKVTAVDAFGKIEIEQDDLLEFLRRKEPRVHDLTISSSGIEVRFDLQPGVAPAILSPPARFLPQIEGHTLVLTIVGFAGVPRDVFERAKKLEKVIDLPPFPAGMRVDISLRGGAFVAEAAGPQVEMFIGEGGLRFG